MELGNLIFGCSRGEYEIEDREKFEIIFEKLLDKLGMDYDTKEFENDTFSIFPYYWGDCTCGFDDYCFTEGHREDCYQKELERLQIAAGGRVDKSGFIEFPSSWSYDKIRKVKDDIYRHLTLKYNLPMAGCAVHCTCDYDERYEAWLKKIGYPNEHKEECLLRKPNFHYKPDDIRIKWYKYPFRDSYSNKPLGVVAFARIIDVCLASLDKSKK